MQAELANSAGLSSNHFCRTCKVGGTREFKQSDDGFSSLFKVPSIFLLFAKHANTLLKEGEPRRCQETAERTFEHLMTALQPAASTSLTDAVRASGVKDTISQPIIDNLVKLGQTLRKATPDRAAHSPDEVLAILTEELKQAHSCGRVMNPLIDMNGTSHHIYFSWRILTLIDSC